MPVGLELSSVNVVFKVVYMPFAVAGMGPEVNTWAVPEQVKSLGPYRLKVMVAGGEPPATIPLRVAESCGVSVGELESGGLALLTTLASFASLQLVATGLVLGRSPL